MNLSWEAGAGLLIAVLMRGVSIVKRVLDGSVDARKLFTEPGAKNQEKHSGNRPVS
jgi:hypothetical protein